MSTRLNSHFATRIRAAGLAAAAILFGTAAAMASPAPSESSHSIMVIPDAVQPAVVNAENAQDPDRVSFSGMLGARYTASETNRLMKADLDVMLAGFRKRPGSQVWIGEHIGKWLHAATLTWVNTGDPGLKRKLDWAAAELIKCQGADGYLGTYETKKRWTEWDVWCHKYDLLGLLTYYRYTGNAPALQACRKIGDLLCSTFGKDKRDIVSSGEHVGMAPTSVMEPMVLLYRQTGDRHYLDFCHYILAAWEQKNGPRLISGLTSGKGVDQIANAKAYEMLSDLVGLCELYRTEGDAKLLVPAMKAWEDITAHRLYITGGASADEHFKADYVLPNEGPEKVSEVCVTVTWMQLNLQLLQLTGSPRYADELERTAYNELLGAQKPSGEVWCYYTPLSGKKTYPTDKAGVDKIMNCCLSSGPRGIALLPTFAYTTDSTGVTANLYEPGAARLALPSGAALNVDEETLYPAEGSVRFRLHLTDPQVFTLKLRIPSWCPRVAVAVNGSRIRATIHSGSYFSLNRTWREGDRVTLQMAMPLRTVLGDHGNSGKIAFACGPLVLAAQDSLNPSLKDLRDFDVPLLPGQPTLLDAVRPAPKSPIWKGDRIYQVQGVWDAGAKSGRAGDPLEVILAPFAVAGRDDSTYRVWLPVVKPRGS